METMEAVDSLVCLRASRERGAAKSEDTLIGEEPEGRAIAFYVADSRGIRERSAAGHPL